MLQAAYDDLGENDGSMKADLQILLDRMDRQLHRIRERQRIAQSRIPCLQCLPPCLLRRIFQAKPSRERSHSEGYV